MERVAFDFGYIKIYWYSIFILIGMIVAYLVISHEAKKRGIEKEFITNLTFYTIIFGLIGARLYYCLFNLSYYLEHPIEIIQIWNGGMAIHGGIILGGLFVIIYCKKNRVELLKMLDIIVVGVIIGQAIGRWGNFFNGEAYGQIVSLKTLQNMHIPNFIINGMYISGHYRQPTFLYESIWSLIGFVILLILRHYPYLKKGQLLGFYLIWYSLARVFIEQMRADSLMLGSFKMAQIISVIFIIVGIIIFIYYSKIKKVSKFEELYKEEPKKETKEVPLFYKANPKP